jgi:myxalamid-type nonribosomal peptide synthetase MxaA
MGTVTESSGVSHSASAEILRSLLRRKAQAAKAGHPAHAKMAFTGDVSLDSSIQPCGAAQHLTGTSSVLLTGATGFLGAHVLENLCRLTNATIYCLVRAGGIQQARQRIEENVRQYVGQALPAERIVPIVGDLAQPRLGISSASFEQLAGGVDAILHNGALLNHLAAYDRLRAANVMSTVELLRLAGSKRPKWMYYVSSMIAANDCDGDGNLLEQLPTANPSGIAGGYARSKWVSEKLLADAHKRGFGVTVFRPGVICGRRDTGAWAVAHDHLLLLLKGCLQMGCAPESPLRVDLSPVDFVSEAIVRLSLAHPDHPVLQLSNPNPVPWISVLEWMNEFGYPLRVAPFDVWLKRHLAQISQDNALFPLLPIYLEESGIGKRELQVAKMAHASREFTAPMLAAANLAWPVVDKELFRKYVRYCISCGFLPPPEKEPGI